MGTHINIGLPILNSKWSSLCKWFDEKFWTKKKKILFNNLQFFNFGRSPKFKCVQIFIVIFNFKNIGK
jgi:hypothetical protein